MLCVCSFAFAQPNLISNPGFESGIPPWFGLGPVSVTVTTPAHSGASAALVSGRTSTWNGLAIQMLGTLQPGRTYAISASARLAVPGTAPVQLTFQRTDSSGTSYIFVDRQDVTGSAWTQLQGTFSPSFTGTPITLMFYAEGPPAGVNFLLDDVSVTEVSSDWKTPANARIEQLRKRDARIHVVDASGLPVPDALLQVRQRRHQFGFGSAITAWAMTDPRYTTFFKNNFEWAVCENEMKWPATEANQGQLTYGPADTIVQFCEANNIKLRGHTVFWDVHQFVQPWVSALANPALQSAMSSRIASLVPRYAGKTLHWDVNNEMLHGTFFPDRLGPSIRPWMFQQVRAADPTAKLFVNDYNVVAGPETQAYRQQILALQAQGAPIDGIGAQGHFGSSVNPIEVLARLDILATLNLPIWITEYDTANPDANARADALEALYRSAFSHPAVEGILMWGFWAGAHWRGGDAALIDYDWSLNAAGQRYQSLLAEWTTNIDLAAPAGSASFRGFHGEYDITVTAPDAPAAVLAASLPSGPGAADITVTLATLCRADFNGDLFLDFTDFDDFILAFETGQASSDLNADGFLDFTDFDAFVLAFERGCGA
jgi:GH35 family endo-1,4-beta-xylanase